MPEEQIYLENLISKNEQVTVEFDDLTEKWTKEK